MQDLTNKKFGNLLVLSRVDDYVSPRGARKSQWLCLCDCGNTSVALGDNLRTGHTKTCGCSDKNYDKIVGNQYGDLTVEKEIEPQGTHRRFLCKCSCGNYTEVLGTHLVRGTTQSCGHISSRGEQKIAKMLQAFNIDYQTQITFEDLKSPKNGSLRFDFGIYKDGKIEYLIEYQGIQHFENTFNFDEEDFQYRKECDHIKKQYCVTHKIPLIEINYDEKITPEKLLMFRTKTVEDESFLQYKKPSMFISNTTCNFKCDKENNTCLCINKGLILEQTKMVTINTLIQRYQTNIITSAVVFGGLENLDEFEQMFNFIKCFRCYSRDDIIIYTGYNPEEIMDKINILKQYPNIIVKYGRFRPNEEPHYDAILGVKLASSNQYAERIS